MDDGILLIHVEVSNFCLGSVASMHGAFEEGDLCPSMLEICTSSNVLS